MRHVLQRRRAMGGIKRPKAGGIGEADGGTIVADIVTHDGPPTQCLKIDRHSGLMREVDWAGAGNRLERRSRSSRPASCHALASGVRTMAGSSTHDEELSLAEMLADPIVRALMDRDGVRRVEVEQLIAALRAKRADKASASRPSNRLRPTADAIGG